MPQRPSHSSLKSHHPSVGDCRLDVALLPTCVPNDLRNEAMVVVDVLRASTTMIQAISAGARGVTPCLQVEQAFQFRQLAADVLLGGERGGEPIDGFDLGNSPADYQPAAVEQRDLVFTSTNGTAAILACQTAAEVLIGALVNLSAVARAAQVFERVCVVCAGTEGQVSWEDTLFAGAFVAKLQQVSNRPWKLSDSAQLAQTAWLPHVEKTTEELAVVLANGAGGRHLLRLGKQADIHWAANIDSSQVVPRLRDGVIRDRVVRDGGSVDSIEL